MAERNANGAGRPVSAREQAFRVLLRIAKDNAYSHLSFGPLDSLSGPDRSFARALVLSTLEKQRLLDELLKPFLRKEPETGLQILLRTGLCQMLFLDRVPDSAACNETVLLAKTLYGKPRANFVNAVLRACSRDKEHMFAIMETLPPAVRYSVSDGVWELLSEQYPADCASILEAFGRPQPLYVRCNTLRVSPSELAARLGGTADGTRVRVTENQSLAIRLTEEGLCFPQGYGSQEAVRLLDAKPGALVVDVCACPGGKSFGAALDMRNEGTVRSFDLHESKLSAVRSGAEKLGLTIVRAACRDGRDPDPSLFGKADRVLCDVPCSGLGTLGAKPEIRYKDPASFAGLYETQAEILSASASYVRPGGVLLYSTCTWNKKENEEQVSRFLADHPAFRLTARKTYLPTEEAGEGFFVSRLEKTL